MAIENPQIKVQYIGYYEESGRGLWLVLQDFYWEGHFVPKGFISDGGSVPYLFQSTLKPTGKGFVPFIIHDMLYSNINHKLNREQSDKQLKRLLILRGVNKNLSHLIYIGLRLGGKGDWDSPDWTIDDAV